MTRHRSRTATLWCAVLVVAAAALPGTAAYAAVLPATVITLDGPNSIYSSSGGLPVQLRAGSADVWPAASSLDGATSVWSRGTAFQQLQLVHAGAIKRTFDNAFAGSWAADVTPDGAFAAVALNELGGLSVHTVNGSTGADSAVPSLVNPESLLGVAIQQNGLATYVLKAGSPATLTLAATEVPVALPGLPAASANNVFVQWMSMSSDNSTLALVLVDTSHSPQTHEAYLITGVGTASPVVTDAGPLWGSTVGRFIGSTLYVATANQLLTYATPADFASTSTATSDPMLGDPWLILNPGAVLGTSFATPARFPTSATVLLSGAPLKSATRLLGTSLDLAPVVRPTSQAEWDNWVDFFETDPSSTFLQFSFDRVHWANFDWATKNFIVTRNVYLRALHTSDTNSTGSVSAIFVENAKPRLVVHYTTSTRRLSGTVNLPTGTLIQVQRRTSSTAPWSTFSSRVRVSGTAWSLTLPRGRAQWRVVVPATSRYLSAVSSSIATR